MGSPTLSVVIPVHNGAGWIGRCMEHVVTAVERARIDAPVIIVVDDGSTDATCEEARDAASRTGDFELRLLSQEHLGRLAARRAGLAVAQSEMVLFIDTRVFMDVRFAPRTSGPFWQKPVVVSGLHTSRQTPH